ncbi:MAG: DUF2130 domain-containing protein, partial [Gammaproteobacteria bacterium]
MQVTFARSASEGKSEKMELVYEYRSGDAFRHKVKAIVETFVDMQEQLNKEKRADNRAEGRRLCPALNRVLLQ